MTRLPFSEPPQVIGPATANADEPPEVINPAGSRPVADLSQIPNLREYAGIDQDAETPYEFDSLVMKTLNSGEVHKYVDYLNRQLSYAEPGTPGRADLRLQALRLQRDARRFDRIKGYAKDNNVSLEAAMLADTPEKRIELARKKKLKPPLRIIQSLGQRARDGIFNYFETLGATQQQRGGDPMRLGAIKQRVQFDPQSVYRDQQARSELLTAVENKAGLEKILTPLGADALRAVSDSVPAMMTAAATGGPVGMYSMLATESYANASARYAIDNPDEDGSPKQKAYAGSMAATEVLVTMAMGKLGSKFKVRSPEEMLTPGIRGVSMSELARMGVRERAAHAVAGPVSEAFEETWINTLSQGLDIVAGMREGVDSYEQLVSALAGAGGGALLGAPDTVRALRARAPELMHGAVDAEDAVRSVVQTTFDAPTDLPPVVPPESLPESAADIPSSSELAQADVGPRRPEEAAPPPITDESAETPVAGYPEEIARIDPNRPKIRHRQAQDFVATLTPAKLEKLRSAELDAESFAELTGIEGATHPYIDAFRDTVDLYQYDIESALDAHAQRAAPEADEFERITGVPESTPELRQAFADLLRGLVRGEGGSAEITESDQQRMLAGADAIASWVGDRVAEFSTEMPRSTIEVEETGLPALGGNLLRANIRTPLGEVAGSIQFSESDTVVRAELTAIKKEFRGQKLSTPAYEQLIAYAAERGKRYTSDTSLSGHARRIYKALGEKGYKIKENPNTEVEGGTITATDGNPVFEVDTTALPSRPGATSETAIAADAPLPESLVSNVRGDGWGLLNFLRGESGSTPITPEDQERVVALAKRFLRRASPDQVAELIPPEHRPANFEDVLQSFRESPLKGKTREEIRVTTARNKFERERVKSRDLREQVRQAREVRQEWIVATMKLVQDNVPPELHPRYARAIAETRTPSQFYRVLDRIDRWAEKNDQKVAETEFFDSLRNAKNMRSEWADVVNDIAESIDRQPKKARKRLESLWSQLADSSGATPVASQLKDAFAMLQKRHVSDLSADELRDAAEAVNQAVYHSQVQNAWLSAGHTAEIDATGEEVVREANKAVKLAQTTAPASPYGVLPSPLRDEAYDVDPRRVNAPLSIKKALDSPVTRELAMRPEDVMSQFSETVRYNLWELGFVQAKPKYVGMTLDHVDALKGVLDTHGLTTGLNVSVLGMGGRLTSRLTRWRDATDTIGGTRMTRAEATLMLLAQRDPDLAGRPIKLQVPGRKTREIQVDEDFLLAAARFAGEAGSDIAEHVFGRLQSTVIDPVNEAHETIHGYPLTRKKNIVPSEIDPDAIKTDDPVEFAQRWNDAAMDSYRHFNERQEGVDKPLVFRGDVFSYYLNHVEQMSRYASYAVPHRDNMELLQRPNVKDAIVEVGGTRLYDMLVDRINREALPNRVRGEADKWASYATRMTAAGDLGFSLTAHLNQFIGMITSAGSQPGGIARLIRTVPEAIRDYPRLRREMMENPVARDRFERSNYVGEATGGAVGRQDWFRPNPILEGVWASYKGIEQNFLGIWRRKMAEDFVRSQGGPATTQVTADVAGRQDARGSESLDKWEIDREWDRLIYRGENASDGMELNSFQAYGRDHAIFRPATLYTSSAMRVYSMGLSGLDDIRSGKLKRGGEKVAMAAASIIGVGILRELFSQEDVDGTFPERMGKRVVLEVSGLHPIGRETVERGARRMMGMRQYGSQGFAGFELMGDTALAFGDLAAYFMASDQRESEKYWTALLNDSKNMAGGLGVPSRGVSDLYSRASTGEWLPAREEDADTTWKLD